MIKITPDTFTSLFRRNFTIKLLSLALAILVWGFTVISRDSMHDLVLPVELQNIPTGYSPRNQTQNQVHFTITGPALFIKAAQDNNNSLTLDLKNTTAGKIQFSNLEKYLNLHQSVRVTRVSPSTMELELFDTH